MAVTSCEEPPGPGVGRWAESLSNTRAIVLMNCVMLGCMWLSVFLELIQRCMYKLVGGGHKVAISLLLTLGKLAKQVGGYLSQSQPDLKRQIAKEMVCEQV